MGLGFAMFSSPNMNLIMSSVDKKLLSVASSMAAMMRTIGMVLGLVFINIFVSLFIGKEMIGQNNINAFIKALNYTSLSFSVLLGLGLLYGLFSIKNKPS